MTLPFSTELYHGSIVDCCVDLRALSNLEEKKPPRRNFDKVGKLLWEIPHDTAIANTSDQCDHTTKNAQRISEEGFYS